MPILELWSASYLKLRERSSEALPLYSFNMNTELKTIVTEVEAMIYGNVRAIANFMELPAEQRILKKDWLRKTIARTEFMLSAVSMVNSRP